MKQETVVLSLGGSVVAPDGLDQQFLQKFSRLVTDLLPRFRVVLMCGGGSVARAYVAEARRAGVTRINDLHLIGIRACQLNAEAVRSVLHQSYPVVLDKENLGNKKVNPLIVAPSTPGYTSDYGSIMVAKKLRARRVINITNVPGVFTADPRKNRRAKLINVLTWKSFIQQFGGTVKPGMHVPFDPLASRLAKKSGITVVVVGPDLKNLQHAILRSMFVGTTISA